MPPDLPPPPVPASSAGGRRLVLVAGAGRSGTSTVAGILQRVGFVVPQPEVLSDETNPRGFSESQWVVDFHDDLLRQVNVQVSDARPLAWGQALEIAHRARPAARLSAWLEEQFAASDRLVIKDPRLSWFLPLWTAAAQQCGVSPAFLTMLRPPAEIVGSKRTYYNSRLQDGHGVAAWMNMMLNTEHATRGSARTFVRYHDLLADWEPVLAKVGADLGIEELRTLPAESRARVEAFVDPGLRRISLSWDDLDLPERLAAMARETWDALDTLPDVAADPVSAAHLDKVRETYDAYYLEAEVVSRSSVIAENQLRRGPRGPGGPPPPESIPPRVALAALAGPALRRVPPPLRRLVPASARARVRDLLTPTPRPGPGTGPRP